jgi:Domain of unknown function (DUF4956)
MPDPVNSPAPPPSALQSLTDLQRFVVEQAPSVPVGQFLSGLAATALLCWLLGRFYERYGRSLSNRGSFAGNFPVIGMTTMLVITIVKSSLALSLGLVGALSIVRFRTAIKEPEELAYLFVTLGVGLGFGANQWLITTCAYVFILAVLWLRQRRAEAEEATNLYLTVRRAGANGAASLEVITRALREHSAGLDLKRFDELEDGLEVSYRVRFGSFEQLDRAKRALHEVDGGIRVSFVDHEGVL